jgi:hypothetical protein
MLNFGARSETALTLGVKETSKAIDYYSMVAIPKGLKLQLL